MITIEVKEVYQWFDNSISVVVNDECNHAGAEREEVDYGGLQHDSVGDLDWFDDFRPALVCKCGHVEDIEPEEPDYDDWRDD